MLGVQPMMHIDIPVANLGRAQLIARQPHHNRLPVHKRTRLVLIADGDPGERAAIHPLLVRVAPVPRVLVALLRARVKPLPVHEALHVHAHVHVLQRAGHARARQQHEEGGGEAGGLAARVHQLEVGARELNLAAHNSRVVGQREHCKKSNQNEKSV